MKRVLLYLTVSFLTIAFCLRCDPPNLSNLTGIAKIDRPNNLRSVIISETQVDEILAADLELANFWSLPEHRVSPEDFRRARNTQLQLAAKFERRRKNGTGSIQIQKGPDGS